MIIVTENDVTSKAKIKANRENAGKSTGPKDTSVTRYNALKHGILSSVVLLKGESRKSLDEFGRKIRTELAPGNEIENILVDRIISSAWRLRRIIKVEREFLQSEYDECKTDSYSGESRDESKAWNMVVSRELGSRGAWLNLLRYETALEKQIYKALHELIRNQSARKGGKPPAPIAIDVDISGEI